MLALLAYGDAGLRFAGDLDFVLRQQDARKAFRLLAEAGYRSELDPERAPDAQMIERGDHVGQFCFRKPQHGLVELHTEKTLRYFPVPLDLEALGSRLRGVSFAGRTISTFSIEDSLVLLSVHGAKHFWNRLSWICDIAELSQFESGVDWRRSESIAIRMGCRRMWLLGLSLANTLLEAPLPAPVLALIRNDATVRTLTGQVLESLAIGDQGEPVGARRLMFRIRSHDSMAGGLRQSFRLITQPTEKDWLAVSLPVWASPLHTLLRPWHLVRKYAFGTRTDGRQK